MNQNFTDLINSLTDGTKSLSIDALTVGGAATLNGAVTLGNASSDDITITGSIAAAIALKTTNVVDIGSATLGLKRAYFGNGSNSNTVGLLGGVTTASYTITLPTTAPAGASAVMDFTTGGVASFKSRTDLAIATKTTTYVATRWDDLILCSGSAFTVTLPAASDSTKAVRIKKTDSSFTNIITIARAGSDTIEDGISAAATSTTLNTLHEEVELVSDGTSKWYVKRTIPSGWTSYTVGCTWSANTTVTGFWQRVGDSIICDIKVATSGAPTSATLILDLPSGLTFDTAKMTDYADSQTALGVGLTTIRDAGTATYLCEVFYRDTNSVIFRTLRTDGSIISDLAHIDQATPFTFTTNDYVHTRFMAPITGWKS